MAKQKKTRNVQDILREFCSDDITRESLLNPWFVPDGYEQTGISGPLTVATDGHTMLVVGTPVRPAGIEPMTDKNLDAGAVFPSSPPGSTVTLSHGALESIRDLASGWKGELDLVILPNNPPSVRLLPKGRKGTKVAVCHLEVIDRTNAEKFRLGVNARYLLRAIDAMDAMDVVAFATESDGRSPLSLRGTVLGYRAAALVMPISLDRNEATP